MLRWLPGLRRWLLGGMLGFVLALLTSAPARAWDLWLVTSQRRILVIRDVDSTPTQIFRLQHDPIVGAYNQALGDFAFAANGRLYGISLTLGTPARLYQVDPTTGAVAPEGAFPFEWGNSLYFEPRSDRGYVGGGLKSWRPYRLLEGFYIFTGYDPATTTLWHDMRPDFPAGGYTVGYAHHQGHLYAFWGQGHMYAHTIYLLRITEDAHGNFVSYVNLGDVESHGIPEGAWDLVSDGVNLYAISPQALYRVTNERGAGPARFTKVMDFALEAGETVNGATARWADLELTQQMQASAVSVGQPFTLTVDLANRGPHPAERVTVRVALPTTVRVRHGTPDQGAFDPRAGVWTVGTVLAAGRARLTLTLEPTAAGTARFQAWVDHSAALDPDSTPMADLRVDDWGDGVPDDDESELEAHVLAAALPRTGFAPGHAVPWAARPAEASALALRLRIPRLDVDAPIVGVPLTDAGWDVAWLHDQVGWLQGSAFPTWAGNTVLTAHVWDADNTPGLFYGLRLLRYGDRLWVHTPEAAIAYHVVDNRLVGPDQVAWVFAPASDDVLTLVTCQGYDPMAGTYTFRRVVRAVRVTTP